MSDEIELRETEMVMLRDGLEHTVAGLCWEANCAGSLPWVVQRIFADRAPEARPLNLGAQHE